MKTLNLFYKGLYYFLYPIVWVLVRLVCPVRALGRENLIRNRGFVLAPNHLFAIDPLFVLLARGNQKKMLVMAKVELFEKSAFLRFIWNITGAFPVNRGTGNKQPVEQAVEEVRQGRGLLIFPEGTRSKDGKLGRLKSGAFVVAMQAQADITPCIVWYKAGKPKLFNRTTIAFGPPLSMEQLGLVGEYSPKKLRAAKEIFAQKLQELRAQYQEQL